MAAMNGSALLQVNSAKLVKLRNLRQHRDQQSQTLAAQQRRVCE
jgi:hypothetical protein